MVMVQCGRAPNMRAFPWDPFSEKNIDAILQFENPTRYAESLMLTEPIISWRISLPLKELPIGPALTPQLRELEEQVGITRDVLWAYANAMPELLGTAILEDIQLLGFGRGALVAIGTEIPVHLPHVQFVQTASEEVCRELGSSVRYFHVKGRACLEALLQHGSAVERVWVSDCPAYEIAAPFEVIFVKIGEGPMEWHIRFGLDHVLRLAALDENVWLCWDRDLRVPVLEIEHENFQGDFGPRDVAPEKHPPPWAAPEAFAYGGAGWATTTLRCGNRAIDEVCVSPNRRWLLLHSFPSYPAHGAMVEAWRDNLPIRPFVEDSKAFAMGAELELRSDDAHFRWVGFYRVLRLRNGECQQLTHDHTLQWEYEQRGEALDPGMRAALAQYKNVVTRSLGSHEFDHGTCDVQPRDRFILLSSSAHEKLVEAAGDALVNRLSEGTVHEAARWAAHLLPGEEGGVRHPVVCIDANAVVTVEPWYEQPIRIRCESNEKAGWQLLTDVQTKPWIWPKRWSAGIREQMSRGELLAETPVENNVLILRDLGGVAFRWRDGTWHDVWVDQSTYKVRASGSITIVDQGAFVLEKPFPWQERIASLEKAGFIAEARWLHHQVVVGGIMSHAFAGWIDKNTRKELVRCSAPCRPSVRDLIEHPQDYDGRRIRTRGILHVRQDAVIFAEATFQCATSFPQGTWLVEVEGEWFCEDKQSETSERNKARLLGDARLISLENPRAIPTDRIVFARPYVPLVAEVLIERHSKGWKFKDRRFIPLHRNLHLPVPSEPDTRRVRMVFVRDAFHVFGVVSYAFLDEPTQATDPVSV